LRPPYYPHDISLLADLFLSKGPFYEILPYATTAIITLVIISLAAWKKSEKSISSVKTRCAALLGLLLFYSTTFLNPGGVSGTREGLCTASIRFALWRTIPEKLIFQSG
jgi:hypothetical protein